MDHANVAETHITAKFFDVNDVEITVQATADTDCVRTEIYFKPDFDYEIISGNIHQRVAPSDDVRIWVIGGALELGTLGTREFVSGLNMYYMGADEGIETDGRTSKYMKKTTTGVPYNTNQLQYTIRHTAGTKHKIMFVVEYFRG